jgi:FkbM family methyltransferase
MAGSISEDIRDYFNHLPDPVLNFIDVGAYSGCWKVEHKDVCNKPKYWVGIEPNPYNAYCKHLYDAFFGVALDNVVEPTKMKFNVNGDGMCSSLLRMKSELITHNFAERDNKWFVARDIDLVLEQVDVDVLSFKHVLDKIAKFQTENIHFIKIDTQGVDIRVVESMGEYLKKTYFIMIESVTSKNKDVVLYEGQVTMEEDIQRMDKLGFKPFKVYDYSSHASPEADIIFANVALVKPIQR